MSGEFLQYIVIKPVCAGCGRPTYKAGSILELRTDDRLKKQWVRLKYIKRYKPEKQEVKDNDVQKDKL